MTETSQTQAKSYKDTLNLPRTGFPMKANLAQNEPLSQKRWDAMHLHDHVNDPRRESGAEPFYFHDGPPYANGAIHAGHLLNKVLKDFVVRTRLLAGRECRYIPGWDCHGLPIEHRVMTELVESKKIDKLNSLSEDDRRMAIRRESRKYAEKYIKLQMGQMQRLLTLADYEHPYLTMTPEYERGVLEVFALLLDQGLVYRALKPVHWSLENQTALAEAELEYYDRVDPSVYVLFEADEPARVLAACGFAMKLDGPVHFMIWTTTPWTLPANLAIAVNPKFRYSLVRVDGKLVVIASNLVEKVTKAGKSESVEVLGETDGAKLVGLKYKHPFMSTPALRAGSQPLVGEDETSRNGVTHGSESRGIFSVVPADYVTLEDGTGLVHTAPGHGVDDYNTGQREGLDIYCPVQADGTYDDTAPEWLRGLSIWKANDLIVERLRESGNLYYTHSITHSYPHDWRGKTPVIFRATDQWFLAVDQPFNHNSDPEGLKPKSLRDRALAATGFDWEHPVTDAQRELVNAASRAQHEAWVEAMEAEERGEVPKKLSNDEVAQLDKKYGPELRFMSLKKRVEFIPEWGRNRMRGMLESRPDWCLSRQRAWGLPIPAFRLESGDIFMTVTSVRAVAKRFAEHPGGSDAWFTETPEQLLKYYDASADPAIPSSLRPFVPQSLSKMYDIFDVWFESGSSWNAVMIQRGLAREDGSVTDLYLEGSDQHRGWFQSSLLPALGATGRSPFKSLLTHGFVVDREGKKMSKSGGNALDVEEVLKTHGADVLRWWVSSISYENDVKVDTKYLDLASESYRKVRNTLRFLLSNLFDYKEASEGASVVGDVDATSIDAWALAEAEQLQHSVRKAYEAYDFRRAHQQLYDFCNDTLSALYCAAVKDRLYCDRADSPRRRQTQRVMHTIMELLTHLLAPLMPHTADEAHRALHGDGGGDSTVHTAVLAPLPVEPVDANWPAVFAARDEALKAMESAKASGVENPLDAEVTLSDANGILSAFADELPDLLGVSRVFFSAGGAVKVNDLRSEPRCDRCWKRTVDTKPRSDGGMLCERCAKAVGVKTA